MSKAPAFEITPHDSVGPVKLGMTRTQVRHVLTVLPESGLDQGSNAKLDYAFGNSLQIEYDNAGFVHFIGVGYYPHCGCHYLFKSRHIGEFSAMELFEVLAEMDGGTHEFNSDSYFFPSLRMTVWDADSQYDYLGGESRPVYGQVGIASESYRRT